MELVNAANGITNQASVSNAPVGMMTPIKAILFSEGVWFIFANKYRPTTKLKSVKRNIAAAINDHPKAVMVTVGVAHVTIPSRTLNGKKTAKRSLVSIRAKVHSCKSSSFAKGENTAHAIKNEIAKYGRTMISI